MLGILQGHLHIHFQQFRMRFYSIKEDVGLRGIVLERISRRSLGHGDGASLATTIVSYLED